MNELERIIRNLDELYNIYIWLEFNQARNEATLLVVWQGMVWCIRINEENIDLVMTDYFLYYEGVIPKDYQGYLNQLEDETC